MATVLIALFIAGYLLISLETYIHINKAAIALITGVLCWTFFILSTPDKQFVETQLSHSLGELAGILFFLMGAMTIVELIDAHNGFDLITNRIHQTSKRQLVWIVALTTFFISPVLDNLTTSIVMVLLLRKIIDNPKQRLIFVGIVIIAANAGGAWSPMGDVTTTMLWIGNQVTVKNILLKLFLPSLTCLIIPLLVCTYKMKGKIRKPVKSLTASQDTLPKKHQYLILINGFFILMSVPVFKMLTGLPPYMGMLIGLGILWIVVEIIHRDKEEDKKQELNVATALARIDTPSILFFLGILLSIAALQSGGFLQDAAVWLDRRIGNEKMIVTFIGLMSSVIDNVPLVAASQGMYGLERFPTDHSFWLLLTYCTGTGGSILLIGSAAGIAAMGMENISFIWYTKKISLIALLGFFGGIAVYLLQEIMF